MKTKAFKTAFPYTLPIMTSFLALGLAYGFYMNASGFSFVYPMVTAAVIFGGSLEFVTGKMLLSPFSPLQTLTVALMIQLRHLFYGISMLDRYKDTGRKKGHLIFGMCDETFSINYTADIPEDVDKGWFYFFVTLLNYLYWIGGATLGGIIGDHLPFDTTGIDFVMTAMFTVIFMEQLSKEKKPDTGLIGLGCAALCLMFFGADHFMIPTMIAILAVLTIFKKPIERRNA